MPTITANLLKAGDIMVTSGGRFRVDAATANPRRKYNNTDGDALVDVSATGVGFAVPCTQFTSYVPTARVTVEVLTSPCARSLP